MNGLLRRASAGGVLLVVMSLAAAAQRGSAVADDSGTILSLENAWNQAKVQHDARAVSMLLAETFDATDDDGSFMNKNQWLTHIAAGVDHYELLVSTGMAVQLYGDVAIVTGIYQEKMTEKRGKEIVRFGRFTDIWIRQSSEWKCVASQATLIHPVSLAQKKLGGNLGEMLSNLHDPLPGHPDFR